MGIKKELINKSKMQSVTRIGGILLLGVFALLVYIGLYDKNLANYQPLHWQLDWVFAAASIIAAIFLIGFPKNLALTILGGIVWPILYLVGLSTDVATRLCLGGIQANCWPSEAAAFQYLIVNNPNVAGGFGWQLWTGTMPTAIALLVITLILTIASTYALWKNRKIRTPPVLSRSGESLDKNKDQEKEPKSM